MRTQVPAYYIARTLSVLITYRSAIISFIDTSPPARRDGTVGCRPHSTLQLTALNTPHFRDTSTVVDPQVLE